MLNSVSKKESIITQSILTLISVVYLIPMVYVVYSSFKGAGASNYTYLFTSGFPILRMIFNSVLISVLQVALIVIVSSPAAFSFSKINFPGRDSIYLIIMLTMSISLLCFITPLFQTMKILGWINTYAALILPAATFWLPVAILILKNYYDSLGNELMEATKIEGGGYFTIWYKVYAPLSKPAAVNVVVFAL